MPSKGGLFFTFKTPYSSITRKQIQDVKSSSGEPTLSALMEDLQLSLVNVVAKQVREKAKVMKARNFTVLATFFQRVCARTPYDEDYEYDVVVTKNGEQVVEHKKHEADIQRVRFDWYILDKRSRRKILTAAQLASKNKAVFDEYNDKKSIAFIKNELEETFRRQSAMDMEFTIGNDNPYFAILEYGGYKVNKSAIKKGNGNKYEHGIENSRSVQAPLGMLRITEMELESMINSSAKTALAIRYSRQRTNKTLNRIRAKALLKKLEEQHAFNVNDLMKIIGE